MFVGGKAFSIAFKRSSSSGDGQADPPSTIDQWLLNEFKTGQLSATQLQEAAKCVTQTTRHEMETVKTFAKLGKSGERPGNCHRDLVGKLEHIAPRTYVAKIPMWNHRLGCKENKDVEFLLPHEVIDYEVSRDPDAFKNLEVPQEVKDAVEEWCGRVGVHSSEEQTVLGLGVWGDTAPYSKRDSLALFLFNILGAPGHAGRRHWVTAIPKREMCNCGCSGRHSTEAVFQIMGWSLQCLMQGLYPKTR